MIGALEAEGEDDDRVPEERSKIKQVAFSAQLGSGQAWRIRNRIGFIRLMHLPCCSWIWARWTGVRDDHVRRGPWPFAAESPHRSGLLTMTTTLVGPPSDHRRQTAPGADADIDGQPFTHVARRHQLDEPTTSVLVRIGTGRAHHASSVGWLAGHRASSRCQTARMGMRSPCCTRMCTSPAQSSRFRYLPMTMLASSGEQRSERHGRC